MSISIQHLRGSESDWSSHNIVVPDGEIMLVKVGNFYKVKVGNGISTAGVLPFLGVTQKTVNSFSGRFTLQNNYNYIFSEYPSNFNLALPTASGSNYEFRAAISFVTGDDEINFDLDESVYYTGDHTDEGYFTPECGYRYSIFFFWDGTYQAIVRAVPNEE